MARARRWLWVSVIGLSGWLLAGCASSLPDWATPKESFATLITEPQEPRVRPQAPDSPPPLAQLPLPPPPGLGKPVIGPPPLLPDTKPPVIGLPPGMVAPSEVTQTSLSQRGTVRVSVRAWVNNRPIFDEEVMQGIGPDFRRLQGLSEPQRSEKLAEMVNNVLDNIIDSELMYQDAVKKLEKAAPHALDKLRSVVEEEYDKSVQKMRKAGATEEQIREIESVAKRMMERNMISTEYARSRIMDLVKSRVTMELIRDYYNTHKNEFLTVDKVVWQDIFIPVSPNLPSVTEAKKFADELLAKCRVPQDFEKLMVYNEGDSKLRNGEGLGQRRGEIRPAELEEAVFQLRQGDIGPVVPFPSGVHLIRVVKREYKGQLPLDESTQRAIRKKLENQLADREYRRLVRELRSRAMIRIERRSL